MGVVAAVGTAFVPPVRVYVCNGRSRGCVSGGYIERVGE